MQSPERYATRIRGCSSARVRTRRSQTLEQAPESGERAVPRCASSDEAEALYREVLGSYRREDGGRRRPNDPGLIMGNLGAGSGGT